MGKVLYFKGKDSIRTVFNPAFGPPGEKVCAIVLEGPGAEILLGIINPQARENREGWDEEMEISFRDFVRGLFRDYPNTPYPPAILILWDPIINESGIIIGGSLFDICCPGFISDALRRTLQVMWDENE